MEEEARMRIDKLEKQVEELTDNNRELQAQVTELREMIAQQPMDPLEGSFRAFKERAGVRRESAQRGKA